MRKIPQYHQKKTFTQKILILISIYNVFNRNLVVHRESFKVLPTAYIQGPDEPTIPL